MEAVVAAETESRPTPGLQAALAQPAPAEVLRLIFPPTDGTFSFDANDYIVVDLRAIVDQWQTLIRAGRTLKIVFSNHASIELLNFFSFDSPSEGANGDSDRTSHEVLAQIGDGRFMSSDQFAHAYPMGATTSGGALRSTYTSGAFLVVTQIENNGGAQAGQDFILRFPEIGVPGSPPRPPDPALPDFGAGAAPPDGPAPLPPPNAAPIIAGAVDTGGVTEDSAPTTASGTIDFADSDLGDAHTVSVTPTGSGYVGTLTAIIADDSQGDGAGQVAWNFSASNAALEFLAQGQTLLQTYTVMINDSNGGTVAQSITIIITGTNDAPVITAADDNATVNEGPLPIMTAAGAIDFGDVDLADAHITSVVPGASGYLGHFVAGLTDDSTGDGSGRVTWLFEATNALRQTLGDNQVLVQTYTVTIDDGHGGTASQLVTITINGTNDAAVITGDSNGAVTEAGGVANAIPGIPSDSGNLDATDVDDPNDTWEAVATPAASDNGYGTFTLTADGVWAYTLNNANATVQALAAGAPLTDTFTVATIDGTSQLVTITITGANDAAVITGDGSGAVLEAGGVANGTPGTPIDSGDLNAADVDNAADTWVAVPTSTAGANGYGTFTLTAAGVWTYTLDNTNAAVQALAAGAFLTDTFTVATVDGTTQLVTVTITGANDAPIATPDNNGGDAVIETGTLAGDPEATGNALLNDSDPDSTDVLTVAAVNGSAPNVGAPVTGTYGSLTLAANGAWTYTLNDADPDTNALAQGQVVADVFTYATTDSNGGTSTTSLTISITGANDAPVAVADGNAGDAVTETGTAAGDSSATGNVLANDTDVDAGDTKTVTAVNGAAPNVGAPVTGTYGALTLAANGVWTYTLNDADPDTNALAAGQVVTDVFTYTMTDTSGATSSTSLTVTITGANDAPTAVADTNAGDPVSETGTVAGDGSAAGNVLTNDTDVDAGDTKTVTAVNGSALNVGAALTGTYGSLTLAANGTWTYTLNNADPDTNALAQGQVVTDVFTYTLADTVGATSSSSLTISITGANDAPVAVADSNAGDAVTETGVVAGDSAATGNVLTNDTDADAGDTKTVTAVNGAALNVGAPVTGTYGALTLAANGIWTYTLNDADPDTNALAQGQVVTDVFSYTMTDANGATSSTSLTITVTGANDAPVAVADGNGGDAVTESGVVAGDSSATGNVLTNDTDVDAGDTETVTAVNGSGANVGAALTGVYGTLTLLANGSWSYALNNTDPDTDALAQGQIVSDSFNYTVADGNGATSSASLAITITGANDAAVVTGDATGAVIEAGGDANGTPGTPSDSGDLNAADVDNAADVWTAVAAPTASTNGYGTYTLTAAGVWAYTLDDNNAIVQALAAGAQLTDTFTVATADGTTQVVTVTITGANDDAIITGDIIGNVDEAGGVNNGTPGNPIATGDLDSTDVDDPDDAWTEVTTPIASDNGYGTFVIAANGVWTFTLDDSNATVQSLTSGVFILETFTVATIDGTPQEITLLLGGADDAPVAVADSNAGDAVTETGTIAGDSSAAGNVLTNDTDVDAGDTKTVTAVNGSGASVGAPVVGTYGSLILAADGSWTYTLNNADPDTNALAQGQVASDVFTYTMQDSTGLLSSTTLTVSITGANDAPSAVADSNGGDAVTETGTVAGDASAAGNVLTNDTDPDAGDTKTVTAVNGSTLNVGVLVAGIYGSLTLQANGSWTYALDNADPDTNALAQGQAANDVFTYTMTDANGATASTSLTISITGANDAPTALADSNGGDAVTETGVVAGDASATGDVLANDTDPDSGDTKTVTAVNGSTLNVGAALFGIYGTLTLQANGSWSYALNDADPDTDALAQGQAVTDTFTYTMADTLGATSAASLTINITGANDAPTAGDDTNGSDALIEAGTSPGDSTATGNALANDSDVDTGDTLTVTAINGDPTKVGIELRGIYGTFTLQSNGDWVYTLVDDDPDLDALPEGAVATDESMTYTITDSNGATATATGVATIIGANDAPIAIADDNDGDLVKADLLAGDTAAIGNVLTNDIDVDTGDTKTVTAVNGSALNVGVSIVGIYGTATIAANGTWTYTLNTSDPDTLLLGPTDTAVDTFTYTMRDTVGATSSATLSVTISGSADPPYINTTSIHSFATPSEPGDLTFINGFSYQDIDSIGAVTVTIDSGNVADLLHATSGGGVTVSGSGSSKVVLTGTIADINAYIAANQVGWDLPIGSFDRNFTLTIDDNGALPGGMVVSTNVFFDNKTITPSDFFSDNLNLAGWTLNNTSVNLGVGTVNDTVVTAWNHGPSTSDILYDGGPGFDTITLVFTPAQLEAILSNSFDRAVLQDYLDGDVSGPFGDTTLSLGGTSWNATVIGFENASLALAAGADGFVQYSAVGEDLPDFAIGATIGNETLVGTVGADTISGLGGNDVLVGRSGNDTLDGNSGADMLLGGSGNDTITGGTGNDILSGGTGLDHFVFADTGAANIDSIVDYSFVDGDTIDLSALLDAGFTIGQPISDFVRAVQSGSNITIQVDTNGGANSFVDVATLTKYGTNSPDIIRVTFEGTDHILLA